jgi:Na+/alanine symporter
MASIPNHRLVTVSASAQIGATGARVLHKVIIGAHTGNAKAVFDNSADGSGTVLLTVSALADRPVEVDLCEVGGLMFDTALYCTLSGTAAIAYVWYD